MDIPSERIDLSRGPNGLGFNIRGGIDAPLLKSDHGIFVTKIRENGTAYEDGRLKEGDKILEVNGLDLRKVSHNEAVQVFVKAGSKVSLLVQHNAEAILKKRLEEKEKEIAKEAKLSGRTPNNGQKSSGISLWTVLGISVIVLGSAFLAKKYMKQPEFLSSFTSKWMKSD